MGEDLDLERVISDPDYRRKAIEELNRAKESPRSASGYPELSRAQAIAEGRRDDS
jgi:hypothetical protein